MVTVLPDGYRSSHDRPAALESAEHLVSDGGRCGLATFRHDRRQSSPAVPPGCRRGCSDRLLKRARHLEERRVARGVAVAPVDVREITDFDHDDGERSRMPPSPFGLELCVLEKVAVGIEERDVVGRPDRAVAE